MTDEYSEETIKGSVKSLEKELGIPKGFLESLLAEDDWSFIIKIHSLLEAAVSHLVCEALGHTQLLEVFSYLEMSNKRSGKLAFVKALKLLDKVDRRFISSLSDLRNQLVHNIKNVNFDLIKHIERLPEKKSEEFIKCFDSFSHSNNNSTKKIFMENPKRAIWYSSMVTVAIIYQKKHIAQLRQNLLKKLLPLSRKIASPV